MIYCGSLIVFYYYYAVYMTHADPIHARDSLIAWIVTTYTNFLVQIAMIVFLLQLKTNFSPQETYISTEGNIKDDISVHSVERVEDDEIRDQFKYLNKNTDSFCNDLDEIRKSEHSSLNSDMKPTSKRSDSNTTSVN